MNHNESRRKSKQEKIGFYIALSVCLVAVGLAAWSTFDSVNKYMQYGDENQPSVSATLAPVDRNLSGITEPAATDSTDRVHDEDYTVPPTEKPASLTRPAEDPTEESTQPDQNEQTEPTGETEDVLQTLLRVTENLQFPISDGAVTQEFSEEAVRNETMNDLRAHMGVDFGGETGDEVVSMCNGIVRDIYRDEMLGNVVVVENEEMNIYYCGLGDDITVEKGRDIFTGNPIGTVGTVPFEEKDGSHIHVEVIVNNRAIDPISVINNNQ